MDRNPEGHNPGWWRRHPVAKRPTPTRQSAPESDSIQMGMLLFTYPVAVSKKLGVAIRNWARLFWETLPDKKSDIVALVGLVLGLGSWGYSVLSPQPQIWFGMLLLSGSFLCLAVLIIHVLNFRWRGGTVTLILVGIVFWVYMHKIVIAPAFKRQLLAALQDGYGIRDECSSRKYNDVTPRYMSESQERWMARTQTTLEQAGKVDDLQMWHESDLIGLGVHGDMIGYRCTRMAIKTGALETIISRHYDSTIVGQQYNGPVYVLDLSKGASVKLPDGSTIELKATPTGQ